MQCKIGDYKPGSLTVRDDGRVALVLAVLDYRDGSVTMTYYAAHSDEDYTNGILTCNSPVGLLVERDLIII